MGKLWSGTESGTGTGSERNTKGLTFLFTFCANGRRTDGARLGLLRGEPVHHEQARSFFLGSREQARSDPDSDRNRVAWGDCEEVWRDYCVTSRFLHDLNTCVSLNKVIWFELFCNGHQRVCPRQVRDSSSLQRAGPGRRPSETRIWC